jgi:hypothetical protein
MNFYHVYIFLGVKLSANFADPRILSAEYETGRNILGLLFL